MDAKKLAQYFDHTALKPDTSLEDVKTLCQEARTNGFFSVCVNPFWLTHCREFLASSDVKLCTVTGFPLGANGKENKVWETNWCISHGAQEIDTVINIGAAKSGLWDEITAELTDIAAACRDRALLKVIVESGILSSDELRRAIDAVNESGAEFIKTSTGFSTVGATQEAVAAMKKFGRPGLKIKASGGIRTLQDANNFISWGADRLGASKSVDILGELKK